MQAQEERSNKSSTIINVINGRDKRSAEAEAKAVVVAAAAAAVRGGMQTSNRRAEGSYRRRGRRLACSKRKSLQVRKGEEHINAEPQDGKVDQWRGEEG